MLRPSQVLRWLGCDDHPVRRLLVVDVANTAHRAYFAGRGRPAFAPDGRPVFLVATFRCLDLATLRRGAPLSPTFDTDAGRVGVYDRERVSSWLTAMGLAEAIRALDP
jgi:hypothetical protein